MISRKLHIGISASFFHPDSEREQFPKKTLLYLEQSMAHWMMSHGAFPVLVPTPKSPINLQEIVSFIDGLILHGGADIAPRSYGETELKPEWSGDFVRDQYEMSLYRECRQQRKPVLGICRGAQLINVAHGGTLYQDIPTQLPQTHKHRDTALYDKLFHKVEFDPAGVLNKIYKNSQKVTVNSIHHQAIKTLGQGLMTEATCAEDGVIEAIRLSGCELDNLQREFVLGVQWHPEFMMDAGVKYLDSSRLLSQFINEIEMRLQNRGRKDN